MRMTNEDWKYKIINASPTRLVIVTYEIILDRLRAAQSALDKGDLEKFRSNTGNAREFVTEMAGSLDMSAPIAAQMVDLYFFVNKLLIKAYFSQDAKFLKDAEDIIVKLKKGLEREVDDRLPCSAPEFCMTYNGLLAAYN